MRTFTPLVFGSMRRSCAVILLLWTAGSAAGQVPCHVDSSHDGNGSILQHIAQVLRSMQQTAQTDFSALVEAQGSKFGSLRATIDRAT
jgi:hypothetical protein